ncbi:MAG: hypothetical protein KF812_13560, partial [Fimbriimonadaceae bacterium]|nr:hypothetical protein [Fimbriimonadaceae bacterium]
QMLMPLSREQAYDSILRLKVGETFVVRQGDYPVRVKTPNAEPVDMALLADFRRKSMLAHGQRCSEVDREIASRWTLTNGNGRDSDDDEPPEVRHVRKPNR